VTSNILLPDISVQELTVWWINAYAVQLNSRGILGVLYSKDAFSEIPPDLLYVWETRRHSCVSASLTGHALASG
jgi:hypothetical protein